MRLSWNQREALRILGAADRPLRAGEIGHEYRGIHPYLCKASGRSALYALVLKDLAEIVSTGAPMTYRITPVGREALKEHSS